jgi:hypothetical protein
MLEYETNYRNTDLPSVSGSVGMTCGCFMQSYFVGMTHKFPPMDNLYFTEHIFKAKYSKRRRHKVFLELILFTTSGIAKFGDA